MTKPQQTDWIKVRAAYECGVPDIKTICARFKVSRSNLYRRARAEEWVRGQGVDPTATCGFKEQNSQPPRAVSNRPPTDLPAKREDALQDQSALIERLYAAFNRQMSEFETNQLAFGDEHVMSEKDARTLGSLARTLEKLIELRDDDARSNEKNEKGPDIEQLRAELARRIERVRQKRGTE